MTAGPWPVAVALGSNLGDREANLDGAVEALSAAPGVRVLETSAPWIETAPVGGPDGQPAYLNGVVILDCEIGPRELFELLQGIEVLFGRDRAREVRHGPRTLDLDLLIFGDEVVDEPDLLVPHPRLEERTFVLEPLARVAPGLRLPGSRQTVEERLARLRADGAE